MSRLNRGLALALAFALAVSALAGCTKANTATKSTSGESTETISTKPAAIRIGTLPTEDALPLWVAESEGLFKKAGLSVTITTFQSAQERDTAFASGSIDAFMGDIIAAANLESAGSPVSLATVMLGATPEEGRFGIVVKPGSKYTSLKELAGVPIATSSASIQEYVVDGLMKNAGVSAAQVKKTMVPKVPARFELLMSGKLEAAALPEPLLSLAVKQGARLIADDTTGTNLSQTVLGVSDKYLAEPAGMVAVRTLLDAWNAAATKIDASPNKWRALLVDKARLPEPIKDSYEVNHYPMATVPTQAEVDAVLAWMRTKKLLKSDVTYAGLVQQMPQQ